jgi:integrase
MAKLSKCETIDAGIQRTTNNRFRINVMANGKRRTATVDSYEQAIAMRNEFRSGNDYVKHVHDYVPYTFAEGWKLFEDSRMRNKLAKGKDAKLYDISWMRPSIINYFGAETKLDDITKGLAFGFFDDITSRYKQSSVNQIGSALYQMQFKAFEKGHMRTLPVRTDRLPTIEGRLYYLSDQLEADCLAWMKANATYNEYAFFIFCLDTGARPAEARAIEWSDIDLQLGRITFWGNTTKTGKSRTVGISERLKQTLANLQRGSNYPKVFGDSTKSKYKKTWDRLRTAMGQRNNKDFIPYALRHTCATKLMANGVDVATIQHWMGHQDIKTTMRYAHFMPERLSLAVAAINARANTNKENKWAQN